MNENQETLYKALRIIADSNMDLEDAISVIEKMSKKEIEQVINKFDSVVTEWDVDYMYSNAYNFEYYANKIIDYVVAKLKGEK